MFRPRVAACVLAVFCGLVSLGLAGDRLGGSDEGAMLTAASRILDGGVFYRDVDAYPFPGSHYALAAVMGAFGEHLAVARALAAVVFAGIVLSLYSAALVLLGPVRAALFGLALLSFKVLAWPGFTGFYYWDFAFLGACVAAAFLVRHRPGGPLRGLVLAGIGAGVALTGKQSLGLYVAAAAGLLLVFPRLWPGPERTPAATRAREIAAFALGAAIPVVPLVLFLSAQGLFVEMIQSGLVRPFTDYLGTSGIPFSVPLRWWEWGSLVGAPGGFAYLPEPYWNLLYREVLPGRDGSGVYAFAGELFVRALYTSLPLIGLGACALVARAVRRGDGTQRAYAIAAVLTLAAALSAFPRADFAHVIGVYPLVLLVGMATVSRLVPKAGQGGLVALEAAGIVLGLAACSGLAVLQHRSLTERLDLDRASLRVAPEDAFVGPVVRAARARVPEGEALFVYGNEAFYYFLADRYSPWRFSQLYPGQTGSDGGRELVARLTERPPALVIRGFVRFPGVPAIPDYAPALDAFVRSRYRPDTGVFRGDPPPGGIVPAARYLSILEPRPLHPSRPVQ